MKSIAISTINPSEIGVMFTNLANYRAPPCSSVSSKTGWWFGIFFIFPYIGNFIIPTDELIFFGGVGIPPTR